MSEREDGLVVVSDQRTPGVEGVEEWAPVLGTVLSGSVFLEPLDYVRHGTHRAVLRRSKWERKLRSRGYGRVR